MGLFITPIKGRRMQIPEATFLYPLGTQKMKYLFLCNYTYIIPTKLLMVPPLANQSL